MPGVTHRIHLMVYICVTAGGCMYIYWGQIIHYIVYSIYTGSYVYAQLSKCEVYKYLEKNKLEYHVIPPPYLLP